MNAECVWCVCSYSCACVFGWLACVQILCVYACICAWLHVLACFCLRECMGVSCAFVTRACSFLHGVSRYVGLRAQGGVGPQICQERFRIALKNASTEPT